MSGKEKDSRTILQAAMTRRFLVASGATALGSLLAACGGASSATSTPFAATAKAAVASVGTTGATTAPGAATSKGTATTIKYMTWFWNEPGRADAWRAIIQKFHDSQKDVRIQEAGWPFNQYTNNVVVQLQAGKIDGDVIQTTPDLALRLLRANRLAPVEDILTKLNITTLSKAHDFIRKDGHLYGLDVVTVTFGLLYNEQLYQKAGITAPAQSVDEWIDVTKRLTKRPDQFGIFSSHLQAEPEDFWFTLQEWPMPFDGIWAKGKTPLVTSPGIINGLKLFKTMYDASMPQGTTGPTATRMFESGNIAQELIVSAAVNVFKTDAPDVYSVLKSAPLPWASKKTITRIHPITVNVQSDKQDAAKAFLQFVYTPENYRQLLTQSLDVVPSYDVGGLDTYFKGLPWVTGYEQGVPLTPPDILGDFIFNDQEFGNIVTTNFQQTLTGNKPVEETMAAAQKQLEALAQRLA